MHARWEAARKKVAVSEDDEKRGRCGPSVDAR
jgi:hypothetical protein